MKFRRKPLRRNDVGPRDSSGAALSLFERLEQRRLCSNTPILVINSNDSSLVPPPGSLRQAILTANNTPGPDTIIFNLFGTNSGAHAITLVAALPPITETVFIDGWSEGGDGYAGQPLIRLDGPIAGGPDPKVGLLFQDVVNSAVRGLAITRFDYGVEYDNTNTPGIANNTFSGNYVGLSTNGFTPIPNRSGGVLIHNSSGNSITHNVLSGNGGPGLAIDHGSGNIITGNFIGTNVNGTIAVANQNAGVYLSNEASNNRIGTNGDGVDDDAERNVISGNTGAGIAVAGSATTGNSIRGNSIYGNNGIGIDLGLDGVTPNTSSPPSGPNLSQNYPVISEVNTGLATSITGSLNSTPNSTFTLDFYASRVANASQYGDGQRWLGYATVTTNAVGNSTFTLSLPASIDAGDWLTATATDSNGNTSEFSQARLANTAIITITSGNAVIIKKNADGIHADITANGAMTQLWISRLSTFTIAGGNGDDTLTIDFSTGNPLPVNGIRFDGGSGANTLTIIGTSGNDTLTAAATGFTCSGGTFSDVPINTARLQTIRLIGGGGGSDAIILADGSQYRVDADTPLGNPNVSVTVQAGAVATFDTDQHLANLKLNGGVAHLSIARHSMFLNGLSISNNGLLDIANSFLYLNNTATSFATAKTYLDAAYNLHAVGNLNAPLAGDYNGLGGITSSIAKTSYAGDLVVGIGYYDGALQDPNNLDGVGQILGPDSNSGHGTGIALNQILIRPTLTGDLNGDGVVNAYDVSLFNSYGLFNNGSTPLGWQAGDMNGDGVVDSKDVTVFNTVGNFNAGSFPVPPVIPGMATASSQTRTIPSAVLLPPKTHKVWKHSIRKASGGCASSHGRRVSQFSAVMASYP